MHRAEHQKRPLLGARLQKCAAYVRPMARVADIGTDHGYLPIYLLSAGLASSVVAADINAQPLETARRNAARLNVTEHLRLVLSDGLQGVAPEEAEDVIVAGMGGELILHIIAAAPWLQNTEKRLILQPMTTADKLRAGLWSLGFTIQSEEAVLDEERVYSVLCVQYSGPPVGEAPPLYIWMGKIQPQSPHSARYAGNVRKQLLNRMQGLQHSGGDTSALEKLCAEIEKLYLEAKYDGK